LNLAAACHTEGKISIQCQSVRYLWWTTWQLETFCSEWFRFLLSISFHQCWIFIFYPHAALTRNTNNWNHETF